MYLRLKDSLREMVHNNIFFVQSYYLFVIILATMHYFLLVEILMYFLFKNAILLKYYSRCIYCDRQQEAILSCNTNASILPTACHVTACHVIHGQVTADCQVRICQDMGIGSRCGGGVFQDRYTYRVLGHCPDVWHSR